MRTTALSACILFSCLSSLARAGTLPPNFQEQPVFTGLIQPTVVKFAPDGRVFVAEKRGVIKVFPNLSTNTPTVFADFRTNVHNFWDRGLLGMTLHPDFPATPYVYVLYTLDLKPGGTIPSWGTPDTDSDGCPSPPGPTSSGCVVGARLSRFVASGDVAAAPEQVLIEEWCQQFPSHSIGSLVFGSDGALYVTGGDGASFNVVDYGQLGGTGGTPVNPCGDPPGGAGGSMTPPTAEGGALRSQSRQRSAGGPVVLDGTVLRLDPESGAAHPTNPLIGSVDPNARRVVADGLRNPFRAAWHAASGQLWVGDVGGASWEEINRVSAPTAEVRNFGWPCYEGGGRQGGYDGTNLNICETLYGSAGAVTAPHFTYNHSAKVVAGETCGTGSSAIAGLAFHPAAGPYPAPYRGALFFTDYNRRCIWVMLPDGTGTPDPARIQTFDAGLSGGAVNLETGPNGDLFYVDFDGGRIVRIEYFVENNPPLASFTASPSVGPAPLTVFFDASSSSDPEGLAVSYAWDLDGDGGFDDATGVTTSFVYASAGSYTVRLQVTDVAGATATASTVVSAENTPPRTTILTPAASLTWTVGQAISFSGQATDDQQGNLPPASLTWTLIMHHCPSNCHEHAIQQFAGVASGSLTAPDHEYPSYLELRLLARDAGGLTDSASVSLDPQTVLLTFETSPAGLQLAVNGSQAAAPFTRTVIVGSLNSLSAPSPQTLAGGAYAFASWSDGGARSHTVTAPAAPATYRASFGGTAPYGGTPASVPGIIQAEHFDEGGQFVAYYDTTAGNHSGAFRATDVDLEPTSDSGGGYNLARTRTGEWLRYTVNVASSDTYALETRVAMVGTGAKFHVEVDGVNRTGSIAVPDTGGWQIWRTLTTTGIPLAAGQRVVRVVFETGSSGGGAGNYNWFRIEKTSSPPPPPTTPYGGTPALLPGIVQAENFDDGAQGEAYFDTSSGNSGGAYRSTNVDIGPTSDPSSGGYYVGWTRAGEWLKYTVNVTQTGTYTLTVRVANAGTGARFRLEADEVDLTGPVSVPNTGGWDQWQTLSLSGIPLSEGPHALRLVMLTRNAGNSGVGNFGYFEFR